MDNLALSSFFLSFFFDCFINYEKGVDPRNRRVRNLDASVFHLSNLREYRLTVSTFTCVKFYLRRGKNYKYQTPVNDIHTSSINLGESALLSLKCIKKKKKMD